ncbi:MAG: hypothetical protein AB7P76_01785 [Candidatus Melainabacteria bacterium]
MQVTRFGQGLTVDPLARVKEVLAGRVEKQAPVSGADRAEVSFGSSLALFGKRSASPEPTIFEGAMQRSHHPAAARDGKVANTDESGSVLYKS